MDEMKFAKTDSNANDLVSVYQQHRYTTIIGASTEIEYACHRIALTKAEWAAPLQAKCLLIEFPIPAPSSLTFSRKIFISPRPQHEDCVDSPLELPRAGDSLVFEHRVIKSPFATAPSSSSSSTPTPNSHSDTTPSAAPNLILQSALYIL
jgi:hypothetical protein